MSRVLSTGAGLAAIFVSGSLLAAVAPRAALAQATGSPAPMGGQASPAPVAASAADAGVNTGGVSISANQLPPAQAKALAAGDNTLITNGPVPDTPANRAKYGKPMSQTGKKTPPAGN